MGKYSLTSAAFSAALAFAQAANAQSFTAAGLQLSSPADTPGNPQVRIGETGAKPFSAVSAPTTFFPNGDSASAMSSADLATGQLRSAARIDLNAARDGVTQAIASASFADSFVHRSNGGAFPFDQQSTARFSFDLDGMFGASGTGVFPGNSTFIQVTLLEPGTLQQQGTPFDETTGTTIIGSSVLELGFMREYVIDITGESQILTTDPGNLFGFATPDVSDPVLPSTVDFEFAVQSDFDFIITLVTSVSIFNATSEYSAFSDFSNTIGVSYEAPSGVDSVLSGSGVFPGTVPAPGSAIILTLGAWATMRRRRPAETSFHNP